ncbi:hypothetical protein GW17_00034039 [Ensete ventricosum]|nr:hypothetical protein GW17_00034039 [Ensete ventricosum]
MEHSGTIRAPPATPRKNKEDQRVRRSAATSSPPVPASSSRCTRSQAAPDWTTYESLVLVGEIAAMDEDWLKALSSYQKWKMISDNCVALDVVRSSNQCKRRWESLLAGYRRIREWESSHGEGSYWVLDSDRRQQLGLPIWFDQEVFSSMGAVLKLQEDWAGRGEADPKYVIDAAGASENLLLPAEAEMLDVNNAQGSKENSEDEIQKDREKARDMASKLQESAQQIHAILREELEDNIGLDTSVVDLSKPNAAGIEFTRRQADRLIKAFGGLAGSLNQFTELIRSADCEGIKAIDSMAL